MAESLHNQGSRFEKRQFKLFTFSRLFGSFDRRAGNISFRGPLYLWLASPLVKILESFASHLIKKGKVKLGNSYLQPASVEVSFDEQFKSPVLVRTLSPITVYSTLRTADGRRKTYYYSPFEEDFSRLIQENLLKKMTILKNNLSQTNSDETVLSNANITEIFKIRPEKVSNHNQHILFFKGTIIKAWSGLYRLDGSPELIKIAFDCGLGSKNSQGFGMIEKYESK